jgi:hypothetical protein
MSQPSKPVLDQRLGEEMPAAALENLAVWCKNTRTRIELDYFLGGGKTAAAVALVRLYDVKGLRRRVLKHCPPPEGGVSLDAQRYRDAEAANKAFTRDHLATLDEFVPDRNDGIFLLMKWRGGGFGRLEPLTSLLDQEPLRDACRTITHSVLVDWQRGRHSRDSQENSGGVTPQQLLQVIAGDKCKPGRSLDKIARELEISDKERLLAGGLDFCNVFRAVRHCDGLSEFVTAGIRGHGHGDLHPGNILVPRVPRPGGAGEQFDEYYLIDLSSFDDNRFLAIDPAHLVLSLANERLSGLHQWQRDQLRELILDPAHADAGTLPAGIAGAVRDISRVGREHYEGQGLFEDWERETLLAVAGCALLFVGRNLDNAVRWWFLQVGGMALDQVCGVSAGRPGKRSADRPSPGADPPVTATRPTEPEQLPRDAAPGETEDGNVAFISATAKRFNDLKADCSRLCAELTDAVAGLDPYLARTRGIPGTGMLRDVLGDLTHAVAALKSWQDQSPYRQDLSVHSAIALVGDRLREVARLVHRIRDNGGTPALKDSLGRAAAELDGAFQYFLSFIAPNQSGSP